MRSRFYVKYSVDEGAVSLIFSRAAPSHAHLIARVRPCCGVVPESDVGAERQRSADYGAVGNPLYAVVGDCVRVERFWGLCSDAFDVKFERQTSSQESGGGC